MERPFTPPSSFRALRLQTRTRTRTISDENKCANIAPEGSTGYGVMPERTRREMSPTRGRTRSRIVRNGLTLNTNYAHPRLSFGLPACCSPVPSRVDVASPGGDDDLIFQMSPVQGQSPSLCCFEGKREVRADANRVKQSTIQTLSALWDKQRTGHSSAVSQHHSPRTPTRRTSLRADSVSQHHRGFSDTHASDFPRRERRSKHQPLQSIRTVFDLSPVLHAPLEPPSSPAEDPFMYSFPTFSSSPLAKAREARASRRPSNLDMRTREEYLTDGVDSEFTGGREKVSLGTDININPRPRHGPIRARNLRIQSGESLSDNVDDTNFISHAFQSASLDPEKDSYLTTGDDRELYDSGYLWSQRSSSISSASTSDVASVSRSRSNHAPGSLLACFPVRPSSRSRTHSGSSSRANSRRVSLNELNPEATATAMMNRGRATKRASNDGRQPTAEYSGGDRRGRGRTPPPGWRSGKDGHNAVADDRTKIR